MNRPTILGPFTPLTPSIAPEHVDLPKAPPNSNKAPAGKTRKYHLVLTPQLRTISFEWFKAVRATYNIALDLIREEGIEKNKTELCRLCVNEDSREMQKPENQWMLNTPSAIREGAIKDLLTAYKANETMMENNNINHYRISYRSRKDPSESINIPH